MDSKILLLLLGPLRNFELCRRWISVYRIDGSFLSTKINERLTFFFVVGICIFHEFFKKNFRWHRCTRMMFHQVKLWTGMCGRSDGCCGWGGDKNSGKIWIKLEPKKMSCIRLVITLCKSGSYFTWMCIHRLAAWRVWTNWRMKFPVGTTLWPSRGRKWADL